ncbi:hypothetical protein BGZ98_008182 [Dissophora globulifera]|nr:hypothetical protein BGZ98_008182 [Dissophora globulifera]
METSTDSFDRLCQQFYFSNDTDTEQALPDSSKDLETALSLVSRAQIYELPSSYTVPSSHSRSPSSSGTIGSTDRSFYRIRLDTVEDAAEQQAVRAILVTAIDPTVLLELPFDRNLSGYSSRSRTEAREAALEVPVVLDMGGLSGSTPAISGDTATQTNNNTNTFTSIDTYADNIDNNKTMLLVPTQDWLRMAGRMRYWRAESHRIKALQRGNTLETLLNERWKRTLITTSSPPPSSGSLSTNGLPTTSLPSPPASTVVSSPTISSRSSTILPPPLQGSSASLTRSSTFKQIFQEQQLDSLVQFMVLYGNEPSATSILRGLLDLIRRQLTEIRVLTWTMDRANLTEQKPEVTVAFLELMARLGLELVVLDVDNVDGQNWQKQKDPREQEVFESNSNATLSLPYPSPTPSPSPVLDSTTDKGKEQPIDLIWTLGPKADDRRLEFWVHGIQQATLPVLMTDDHSLLPSTTSGSGAARRPNPVPVAVRHRFLQDRKTIAAGSIHVMSNKAYASPALLPLTAGGTAEVKDAIVRDQVFVLSTSKYAISMSGTGQGSGSSGLFAGRVTKDVKHLARWATTCGGRLDWIWEWLFASFQKARHGGATSTSGASRRRPPEANDENV